MARPKRPTTVYMQKLEKQIKAKVLAVKAKKRMQHSRKVRDLKRKLLNLV